MIKELKKEDVPQRQIMWLYEFKRDNFCKGIFKEKIAYEA